eukprot:m.30597 g.30597  ORF g.30597 m.30597 type:complete len:199 (+) comp9301_c0_seq3:297-893(+)
MERPTRGDEYNSQHAPVNNDDEEDDWWASPENPKLRLSSRQYRRIQDFCREQRPPKPRERDQGRSLRYIRWSDVRLHSPADIKAFMVTLRLHKYQDKFNQMSLERFFMLTPEVLMEQFQFSRGAAGRLVAAIELYHWCKGHGAGDSPDTGKERAVAPEDPDVSLSSVAEQFEQLLAEEKAACRQPPHTGKRRPLHQHN